MANYLFFGLVKMRQLL